ncbi:replication initiator protein A [Burkholderia sp. Bp9031]|uniref:replication initiator protein A n=1 Tax=Burkholderia sp. Bp9031 TaxID=2184566 RepID=UPI001C8911C6|nr:replication initiator protein A [Burkholderia sp. Bp9031]
MFFDEFARGQRLERRAREVEVGPRCDRQEIGFLLRQRDFFVADILDVAPKDDMASMEHPLFALKAGDMRVRTYERNGTIVKVMPGTYRRDP